MLRARSDCVTSWTSAASPGAGCDPLTSPPAILLAPVPEMETKGLSCSCDCVDRLKGKSVLTCVHTPRLCPPFVPARCRPCRQGWHGNSVRVRRRGLRQRSVQIVSLRPAAFFFSRRGRTAGRVESGSTGATPSSVDPLHPTRTRPPISNWSIDRPTQRRSSFRAAHAANSTHGLDRCWRHRSYDGKEAQSAASVTTRTSLASSASHPNTDRPRPPHV